MTAPAPLPWTERLEDAIVRALATLRERHLDGPICAVALDLHPWHPVLELSILTEAARAGDPLLLDVSEQAAWPGFHATDPRRDGRGLSKHAVAEEIVQSWRAAGQDRAARHTVLASARVAFEGERVRDELARWAQVGPIARLFGDPDRR